jgi:hypothetical protein
MVMNNTFKYLGKITEKEYWPAIANRNKNNCCLLLLFLKTRITAACFNSVGK